MGTFGQLSKGPLSGGSAIYSQAIKASPVEFPAMYAPDETELTQNMYYSVTQGSESKLSEPLMQKWPERYKEYEKQQYT